MGEATQPEAWQRGPLPGITPLLQPAAHAILQAAEEVQQMMQGFPAALLFSKAAGMASPGFHLRHMAGVLDRLFTYAAGNALSETQLQYLKEEVAATAIVSPQQLVDSFCRQANLCLEQLKQIPEADLLLPRGIGRKQIPTNVIGLIFHAAEHVQRHTGQLLVTIAILKAGS